MTDKLQDKKTFAQQNKGTEKKENTPECSKDPRLRQSEEK